MNSATLLECIKYATRCEAVLANSGLVTKQVNNIQESLERMEAIRDYPVSYPLSARMHDFTESDSFWLFFQSDGKDVGGVCCKCINLGSEKFHSYIARALRRQFFSGMEGTLSASDISGFLDIRGQIVYLGDLFLAEDMRGSKERVRSIMHLLFTLSLCKWPDLDWIYSFLRNKDVGKAHFYGFAHNVPTPLNWSQPSEGRSNDEYLAALSRSGLKASLRTWLNDGR